MYRYGLQNCKTNFKPNHLLDRQPNTQKWYHDILWPLLLAEAKCFGQFVISANWCLWYQKEESYSSLINMKTSQVSQGMWNCCGGVCTSTEPNPSLPSTISLNPAADRWLSQINKLSHLIYINKSMYNKWRHIIGLFTQLAWACDSQFS